jgi:hypothetical protein
MKTVKPNKDEFQIIKDLVMGYFLETGDVITAIDIGAIGISYKEQDVYLEGVTFKVEPAEDFVIGESFCKKKRGVKELNENFYDMEIWIGDESMVKDIVEDSNMDIDWKKYEKDIKIIKENLLRFLEKEKNVKEKKDGKDIYLDGTFTLSPAMNKIIVTGIKNYGGEFNLYDFDREKIYSKIYEGTEYNDLIPISFRIL